jgi:FkbM family methyltransferase
MRFIQDSLVERAIRGISLRAIRRVERSGNADIESNGEAGFLQDFLRFCAKAYPHGEITVIDGGAHKGNYLSKVCSGAQALDVKVVVHAFEPSGVTFSELTQNHGDRPNVKFNNTALSDANGTGTIHLRSDLSALASIYNRDLRSVGLALSQTEPIRLARLDTYIAVTGIEHIHLLKLDVEGSEYVALQGLGERLDSGFVDFVQFEYGGSNLDSRVPLKAFFDLFETRNFIVGRVFPRGLKLRPYSPWMDNFDYANFVAISRAIHDRLLHPG